MGPGAHKIEAGFHNGTHIIYLATVKLLYFFIVLSHLKNKLHFSFIKKCSFSIY